jgi:hypothetical protein
MENLLNWALEVASDGESQGTRRIVAARLDRVDRLTRDPKDLGQLSLRHSDFRA